MKSKWQLYIIYDDNDDDDNNDDDNDDDDDNNDNDNDERCLKHLANSRLQQWYDDQKIGNFPVFYLNAFRPLERTIFGIKKSVFGRRFRILKLSALPSYIFRFLPHMAL